jgi:16S rRNA (cytidine1402-2'-O)-methyltransferase
VSNGLGCLYVVATPIGNLGDITRRAVETLQTVDGVLAEDTRHTGRLLDHLGIQKPLQSLHEHNEGAQIVGVLDRLQAGARLALVSDAGTPLISDPGYALVRACRDQGIDVRTVPGPSALIAALSISGLPTDRFRFEGFPPRRSTARREFLASLADERATLVFYESAHRIGAMLEDAATAFGPQRPAVLARELTKRYETVHSAPLGELVGWVRADADQQRGEIVLMVAGRPDEPAREDDETLLRLLLDELPVRQAVGIVARYTEQPRNEVYRRALALQAHE